MIPHRSDRADHPSSESSVCDSHPFSSSVTPPIPVCTDAPDHCMCKSNHCVHSSPVMFRCQETSLRIIFNVEAQRELSHLNMSVGNHVLTLAPGASRIVGLTYSAYLWPRWKELKLWSVSCPPHTPSTLSRTWIQDPSFFLVSSSSYSKANDGGVWTGFCGISFHNSLHLPGCVWCLYALS